MEKPATPSETICHEHNAHCLHMRVSGMDHSLAYWARVWSRQLYTGAREDGLQGIRRKLMYAWREMFRASNRKLVGVIGNPGRPIYEPDWDVLVILDACRVDLMDSVTDEYEFLPCEIGTFRSRGSKSNDWMARNFTPDYADEMAHTAYVTGNPFSRDLDPAEFAVMDEVWTYAWDDDLHTIPARALTDRAIATWRDRKNQGVEKMIVHYMQPHGPFVTAPELGSYGGPDEFGRGNR